LLALTVPPAEGEPTEAILRARIADGSADATTFWRLASLCGRSGRWGELENLCARALELDPGDADALQLLGLAQREKGDLAGAEALFRQALVQRPGFTAALNNLGITLQQAGDLEGARACYAEAIAACDTLVEAHSNLGHCLLRLGRAEEARPSLERALALQPDHADALNNLGDLELERGANEAAIDLFRRAIACEPDHALAHTNLSQALLRSGDYAQGWAEYEWRLIAHQPLAAPPPPTPVWDGRPLDPHQTLLLVSEQGLGDTLQFMRYLLPLQRQGIPVRLAAQSKLHGILRASAIDPNPLHPHQADAYNSGPWLPLLSLPGILGVSPHNPLHTDPYIHTTPERLQHWQQRLAQAPRPLVAIAWQGNPAHETSSGRGRSLPLESFAALALRTDITFLSLQKGPGSEQLTSCSFRHRFIDIQDEIDQTWDFLDAAAILACCDLVISSDTALAHLAGGMGATTWLLLQNLPEWRWGLQGDASPWYPSMRLFRQDTPGDWHALLQRVADEFLHLQQLQQLLTGGEPEAVPAASPDATPAAEPPPILAPISLGELIDKITILDLKNERLQGAALANVQREREALRQTLASQARHVDPALVAALHHTNSCLWEVEDQLRDHERQQDFGASFVELARSVYRLNDERAALKKRINLEAGSLFVEEKSYAAY
jgi:tetratricopeptide (TPR) repeat protein